MKLKQLRSLELSLAPGVRVMLWGSKRSWDTWTQVRETTETRSENRHFMQLILLLCRVALCYVHSCTLFSLILNISLDGTSMVSLGNLFLSLP